MSAISSLLSATHFPFPFPSLYSNSLSSPSLSSQFTCSSRIPPVTMAVHPQIQGAAGWVPDNGIRADVLCGPVPASTASAPRSHGRSTAIGTGVDPHSSFRAQASRPEFDGWRSEMRAINAQMRSQMELILSTLNRLKDQISPLEPFIGAPPSAIITTSSPTLPASSATLVAVPLPHLRDQQRLSISDGFNNFSVADAILRLQLLNDAPANGTSDSRSVPPSRSGSMMADRYLHRRRRTFEAQDNLWRQRSPDSLSDRCPLQLPLLSDPPPLRSRQLPRLHLPPVPLPASERRMFDGILQPPGKLPSKLLQSNLVLDGDPHLRQPPDPDPDPDPPPVISPPPSPLNQFSLVYLPPPMVLTPPQFQWLRQACSLQPPFLPLPSFSSGDLTATILPCVTSNFLSFGLNTPILIAIACLLLIGNELLLAQNMFDEIFHRGDYFLSRISRTEKLNAMNRPMHMASIYLSAMVKGEHGMYAENRRYIVTLLKFPNSSFTGDGFVLVLLVSGAARIMYDETEECDDASRSVMIKAIWGYGYFGDAWKMFDKMPELLGVNVVMANDCSGEEVVKLVAALPNGGVLLLENVMFYKEEKDVKAGSARIGGLVITVIHWMLLVLHEIGFVVGVLAPNAVTYLYVSRGEWRDAKLGVNEIPMSDLGWLSTAGAWWASSQWVLHSGQSLPSNLHNGQSSPSFTRSEQYSLLEL